MEWFRAQLAKAGDLDLRAQYRLFQLSKHLFVDEEKAAGILKAPPKPRKNQM